MTLSDTARVRPRPCELGTGAAPDRRLATVVPRPAIGPGLIRNRHVPGQTRAVDASDTAAADGQNAG
jgi:hypothetical protein